MSIAATRVLKQVLFDAYGGFADKRLKNLDNGYRFIIDDRAERDKDARGNLYSWFCQIFAEVIDHETVQIKMGGGVPESSCVAMWFAEYGAEQTNFGWEFTVRRDEEERLAVLADAFRAVVRPGAGYPVNSYKYVCPRVAGALDKLRHVLGQAWAESPPAQQGGNASH